MAQLGGFSASIFKKLIGLNISHKRFSNKDAWESEDAVRTYSSDFSLQEPEKTILSVLRYQLKNMKMLDIGVGTGRSTRYFAHIVREYEGVDYSETMLKACRRNFPKYSFKLADARYLASFEDNQFDFVLFSFNGLDCINHKDRIEALHEIRRVMKKGGYFCFSAHNLNFVRKYVSFNLSKNPVRLLRESRRLCLMRFLNRNEWGNLRKPVKSEKHLIIREVPHGFVCSLYYIEPEEQIKQLREIGFKNTRVYRLFGGKEIQAPSELQNTMDPWLYYLASS